MGAHTLQYKHKHADWVIPDPGSAGAISNEYSGVCLLSAGAAAETRTLGDPTYVGQWMTVLIDVLGGGIVVTIAHGCNVSDNTVLTLDVAGDHVSLVGVKIAGELRWRAFGPATVTGGGLA